jgi:hypothetical protein
MLVATDDTELDADVKLALKVAVSDREPVQNQPVVGALKQFSGLCAGIVNATLPLVP